LRNLAHLAPFDKRNHQIFSANFFRLSRGLLMLQAVRCAPVWFKGTRLSGLGALLRTLGQSKPGPIAAVAAALAMSVAVLTGALNSLDRRLSDAWFGLANIAPSERTVLVHIDRADGFGIRISRRDLAALLLQLDAAGAARILIEIAMAEQGSAADDIAFERALAKLGRKVSFPAMAVLAANQTTWHRGGVSERYARHVTRTASDVGLDPDGRIRRSGIEDAGLPYLVSAPAWLIGAKPAGSADVFRVDFGIDLKRIPIVKAASVMQGRAAGIADANVIITGYALPAGTGLRVPRYGELTRPQFTALAAETLALGRTLRAVPAGLSGIGLVVLAGLIALWCVPRGTLASSGLCGLVVLCAVVIGGALQVLAVVIVPTVGVAVAAVLGYGAAQLMVHPAFRRLRQAVVTVLADIDVEVLNRIATEDALTGVANRRAFEQALRHAYAANERHFALLMCDLDGFKQVNDTMGHKAGDVLLREIATRLVTETGPNGIVARLGGDEFAILLPRATQTLAAEAVQRLAGAVARPIDIDGRSVNVGVSIGVALGSQNGDEHALMENADAAMYATKRSRAGGGLEDARGEADPPVEPPAASLGDTGRLYARAS
jgi:diguanylate cyclase (GGDEF)-like protein